MRRLLMAAALAAACPAVAVEPGAPRDPARGLSGAYDDANPFAKILRGEAPAAVVHEDAGTLALIPLDAAAPGHALVIPKRAVRNLLEMAPAEMGQVLDVAKKVALAQQRALGATGFKIVQNNGMTSDQHVHHVHFHVIPSFGKPNDAAALRKAVPYAERQAMAAKLRAAWPRD
jgi:diadenosine tetraphosphate (Ap4A) HIT family hydrolase